MFNLALSKDDTLPAVANTKRFESIAEAISWPKGLTQDHKLPMKMFSKDRFVVQLSKPGKEAEPSYMSCKYKDGSLGNNPNDMRPEVVIDGVLMEKNATFVHIFEELQRIHLLSPVGIRMIACLLGRSAYMVDHVEIAPGIWRYQPPLAIISQISGLMPEAFGLPIEVFMHYLEALALNEDTKYHTLGYDIKTGTGRRNNLLTCVNVIAVLLGEVGIASFAGNFARPPVGISAISLKRMKEIFPELEEK